MTTEGLREPGEKAQEAEAMGRGQGHGLRADGRLTTTVPVMPLWERLGGGVRG
ncbi:hypothetical protein AB0I00_00165 [Streptomyces sp. NPDC050803]|uniref:hypothetical protein n=1 Tax=unclassified Streptomyces TaxID=2593676 RepID=UPI00342FCA18